MCPNNVDCRFPNFVQLNTICLLNICAAYSVHVRYMLHMCVKQHLCCSNFVWQFTIFVTKFTSINQNWWDVIADSNSYFPRYLSFSKMLFLPLLLYIWYLFHSSQSDVIHKLRYLKIINLLQYLVYFYVTDWDDIFLWNYNDPYIHLHALKACVGSAMILHMGKVEWCALSWLRLGLLHETTGSLTAWALGRGGAHSSSRCSMTTVTTEWDVRIS